MNNKVRIGIDCRLSGDEHAGIGRYIEELILRLPQYDKNINWILFFYSQKQKQSFLDKLNKLDIDSSSIKTVLAPIKHYSLAEQLRLPKIFSAQKLDLLHVPHFNIPIFYQGKIVITIHDLLWHEFKGLQVTTLSPIKYLLKYLAYKAVTDKAIKKAERIIVPAKSIKKTVLKHYPSANNKIVVTHEGASQLFKPNQANAKAPDKTLVYVGSLYPHKNLKVVLEALPNLPNYQLKIVGSRNIFQDETKKLIKKYGLTKQATFTGYLPDADLNKLLQSSFALVQPSLSEGFGLTGVEAMASGIPVIASKIPIFKEIYQNGAIYFDPNQPLDFVQAVKELEQANRSQQIKLGLKVASQYSWDEMTKQTLQVYSATT